MADIPAHPPSPPQGRPADGRRSAPSRPAPHEAEIGLSIVVPVYRGAATVGRLVEALSALRPAGGLEIVLVNDGSPDNSGERLPRAGGDAPPCRSPIWSTPAISASTTRS